ncbi:MAG: NAD(+)/NADH kinase [Acidobacteria bacterium]|nr:NAD(+)/NADH kinase [Acidobacteriota bacterium]
MLKRQDPRVPGIVNEVVSWLQARGADVFVDQESGFGDSLPCPAIPADKMVSAVDVVTVFGGDGTFLHAARIVASSGVPILGVNLGSLGFLAEVNPDEVRPALQNLLNGDYDIEERMCLEVEAFRDGRSLARYMALNDAVINKGAIARIIELEVRVNDQLVSVTRADGLIVSTPTGSTAYSLSAGGPILYPSLGAFLVTPICPHTLTNRPVVVPDQAQVSVYLLRGADVMLTVDGQVGIPLEPMDHLAVRKAAYAIRMVQPAGSTFFSLLRAKLKWG